jgi:arylsulfatase A-like enzyme
LHWPAGLGTKAAERTAPISSEDLMPTILGLCGLAIPETVEGIDFSDHIKTGRPVGDGAAMIMCPAPFGEWTRNNGGREYRGVRTERYTYVRDLKGPWLLFDNQRDPFQTNNLVNTPASGDLQTRLDATLQRKLNERKDQFLPSAEYIRRWGYQVDANGTVPYAP